MAFKRKTKLPIYVVTSFNLVALQALSKGIKIKQNFGCKCADFLSIYKNKFIYKVY